jgi:hypothetical protein
MKKAGARITIGQLRNNIKENADHFVIVNPWMLVIL